MQEILAIALQSMHQDMVRLDHIGVNLANALTPGYKRDVVSVGPAGAARPTFSDWVERAGAAALQGTDGPALQVRSDPKSGSLRATGQNLDLALSGPGYFEIQTATGPAYTRQGTFGLDANSRLVTAQGEAVMGLAGEIVLPNASPSIDPQGRVFDRSAPGQSDLSPLAQIKLLRAEDPGRMQRLGNGLFAAPQGESVMVAADVSATQVRQGYLENSNVSSMQEMVQMIQTMRHFESMQKVAVGYDEMIGGAVRKLGELS